MLLLGPLVPGTWRHPDPPPADFFTAKGVLAELLTRLGAAFELAPGGQPFLHPGRSAAVQVDGAAVGWLGELHPRLAEAYELRGVAAAFELDLDAVPIAPTATYTDLVSFPALREDLAVVVPDDVSAAAVLATVRAAAGPLLVGVEVFDVYRDAERLGADRVSLALALNYRAGDRTLTTADVTDLRQAIAAALTAEHGGAVRDA